MRTIAAAMAACVAAGCATSQRTETAPTVVRTKAPAHYQETVTNYFDIMMRGPQTNRKLAFGSPEASDCAIRGSGGFHQGWMVPVIYDTSPASTPTTAKGARTSTSGTAAANKPVQATVSDDGVATATLNEVKISGKGYFFWFSSDTISAVTRRADSCPP